MARRGPVRGLFERVARDPAVRRALALTVALRVALGALAALAVRIHAPAQGALSGALPAINGPLDRYLIAPWERFDALDFEHIARSGYDPGEQEQHYFPLLPLLERALGFIDDNAFGVAGLVVSTIAFAVGLTLLHHLVAADLDDGIARRTVLLVALAPVASFFLAPYTESLFLALSVGAILAARRRHFLVASLLAVFATLSRPQGILVAIPVLMELTLAARAALELRRPLPWSGLSIVLAPAALGGFFVYTRAVSGLTPLQSEQLQMVHFALPWQGLFQTIAAWHTHPVALVNAAILVACIALFVLMLLGRPPLPLSYIAYTAASVLVIASRESDYAGRANPLVASDRFALVVFPLFVVVAWLTRNRPRTFAVVLTLSAVLMVARFLIYVSNIFAA